MRNKSTNEDKVLIGITGGIGSGKSLAADFLVSLGIKVINADLLTKELYKTNKSLKLKLVRIFGRNILNEKGDIGGHEARNIIFSSAKNIKRVNSIVHPFVIKEIHRILKKVSDYMVMVESAIMYESGFYKHLNFGVLIYANKSIRLKRVTARDKIKAADVQKLMKLQIDENEKLKRAEFIIKNNGTKQELKQKIKLLAKILKYF